MNTNPLIVSARQRLAAHGAVSPVMKEIAALLAALDVAEGALAAELAKVHVLDAK